MGKWRERKKEKKNQQQQSARKTNVQQIYIFSFVCVCERWRKEKFISLDDFAHIIMHNNNNNNIVACARISAKMEKTFSLRTEQMILTTLHFYGFTCDGFSAHCRHHRHQQRQRTRETKNVKKWSKPKLIRILYAQLHNVMHSWRPSPRSTNHFDTFKLSHPPTPHTHDRITDAIEHTDNSLAQMRCESSKQLTGKWTY